MKVDRNGKAAALTDAQLDQLLAELGAPRLQVQSPVREADGHLLVVDVLVVLCQLAIDGGRAGVQVGRVITFNVDDVTAWTIASSDEAVVKVTAGKDDGSAQFLPGGEALAAGTAEVTLTNMDNTEDKWVVTVTVTE